MTAFPTDYDEYAPTYARARSAVPWVFQPLRRVAVRLPSKSAVLEIGCGTGNYIGALAGVRPDLACSGLDASDSMLREARRRAPGVPFVRADAARGLPYADQSISFAFAVDVIHYIRDLRRFLTEIHRVLDPGGQLVIVTDSEDTLRRRSLTAFFPEVLPIELLRYPTMAYLQREAGRAGMVLTDQREVKGTIPLDADFLARLEAKCMSSLRLITSMEHRAGMERVRSAALRGERWLSIYDILRYTRPA